MYLQENILEENKKLKVNHIFSNVLKIKNIEHKNNVIQDDNKIAKFVSDKMIEDIKKMLIS